MRRRALMVCAALTLLSPALFAATEPATDDATIQLMEDRATTAPVRDQAILFTELAERLTLVASQQLQAGDVDRASATLVKIEHCADKIQAQGDSKSRDLKKAEMRLHDSERRLRDMVRASTLDIKPKVQATLKRMSAVQASLLNLLFSK